MAAAAIPTHASADGSVAAELRELRLAVHRLTGIVQSRLAMPVDSLTVAEAMERMKCCEKTIRRLLARGVFTDVRGNRTNGSTWKLLSDEVDLYRLEGAEALKAFRKQTGRD